MASSKPENSIDMVHKPPHYQLPGLGVEIIDVRSALLKTVPPGMNYEAVTSWSESVTYLMRMWGKNGLEDAEKSLFYLQRMIAIMKGEL